MEKKNNFIIIVIVALSILVGLLGGYFLSNTLYDKNNGINDTSNNNDDDKTTNDNTEINYISQKKIRLSDYCSGDSCHKTLGTIKIDNNDYLLSVNLNNINSGVNGSIRLGENSANIDNLIGTEFNLFNYKIDGFEVYDKYLILYTTHVNNKDYNTAFIDRSNVVLDNQLNVIKRFGSNTCGNNMDTYSFNNNTVTYSASNTQVLFLDIYDEKLNVNNYDVMDVKYQISFSDWLNDNHKAKKAISINYNCGEHQG